MAEGKQRKLVYYSGRVQGVGFRYTTRQIAARFDVKGFVRNLSDGRVELVVEGLGGEVSRFLAEVETRFADNLSNTEAENGVNADEFSEFEIRF